MKKKISLLLCMLIAVLVCATGCGSEESTLEYDPTYMQDLTEFMITYCNSIDETSLEQIRDLRESVFEDQLVEMGLPVEREEFLSAIDTWKAGVEECGSYVEHGEFTFEVSADELTVVTEGKFAERDASIEFVYDENLYLESVSVNAVYSLGEILQKAALNTVLGMGTVFVVLIIISVIISLLKYIPEFQEKFSKKQEVTSPVQEETVSAVAEEPEPDTDDKELIAVIAAAIAAAEGTTVDGFVVRSIKRRKSNKWN